MFLDDNELEDQRKRLIAPPLMGAIKDAVTLPGITVPPPDEGAQPDVNLPDRPAPMPRIDTPTSVRMQSPLEKDTDELSRLKSTGSGVSQKHGLGGGILKTLDVIGSTLLPGLAENIPGTTAHHDQLVRKQQGMVNSDVDQEKDLAQKAHFDAKTKKLNDPDPAKERNPEAQTFDSLVASGKTPQEAYEIIKGAGKQAAVENPELDAYHHLIKLGKSPDEALEIVKSAGKKAGGGSFEDKSYEEWHKSHPQGTMMQFEKERSINSQAPQRQQQQLAVIDGKVVELRPGMTVPKGTESLSGELKGSKPSADEVRRSDLGKNALENISAFEDIVNRRPELFGPVNGRLTWLAMQAGSDDPDIVSLKSIKEFFGMAAVGTHAMRNAQHVKTASDALMDLHAGPEAILDPVRGSLVRARKSIQTFIDDAKGGAGLKQSGSQEETPEYERRNGKLVRVK